ncbi:hypothetical protein [Siminovitchia sp. 179-K 8D1 HS]|uniref:hypothetical protein n=1 Tax=Siminovitchia sp. 179-K 8D1 HS TaxID=3142385 RepID=UPI00399F7998
MIKDNKYIIRIDGDYLVGFEGKSGLGKTSHGGWNQQATEMREVQLSMYKCDAKVFDGKINLKSGLNKLYDRMRYGNFDFDHLEVIRCE